MKKNVLLEVKTLWNKVVPDRLYEIAYENGISATKLSDYLGSAKKNLSRRVFRKE